MSPLVSFFLYSTAPILGLATAGCLLVFLEGTLGSNGRGIKTVVATAGPVASIAFTVMLLGGLPASLAGLGVVSGGAPWFTEFIASYHLDGMTLSLFLGIGIFTLFTLVFLSTYFSDSELRSEVFILTLFVASGMLLLVSADSLLTAFLALELLSLPTYVLVGIYRQDKLSCEAALKYFLFGSFATVLFVLGIALLYGQLGTFQISKMAELLRATPANFQSGLVLAGLAAMLTAVAFKIGVVPFHMWVPDTYQGALAPVTGFMGSAVKMAGFGLAVRLLWGLFLPLSDTWISLVDGMAIVTMFLGNIAALKQDNLKRLFAYSSISHAGYLLIGVTSLSKDAAGGQVLFYYLLTYGLMFLGVFAILMLIEKQTESTDISQIAGLGTTKRGLAACLAIFSLSAAGIPPTAGFFGKYFIFLSVVNAGKTPFAVMAVISSLIGVYYYLRVIVFVYMKEPKARLNFPRSNRIAYLCIYACALSMLGFALFPQIILR